MSTRPLLSGPLTADTGISYKEVEKKERVFELTIQSQPMSMDRVIEGNQESYSVLAVKTA